MLANDLLHEWELGEFKTLFTHLVRILHAEGADRVKELNERWDFSNS